MTSVRFAQASDIPALVELGRQIHVQSRYAWMNYSAGRTWQHLERLVSNRGACVIVATSHDENGTAVSGVLIGTANQYPFNHDFVAEIELFYVVPHKRGTPLAMKMVTAFRRWANNREVAEITITNQFGTGEARTARLFSKLGMPAVGGVHSMWV